MPVLQLQPNETKEVFDARKKRVYDSFITSMTIQTTTGVMSHGNNESFVEEANLPDHIRSILFSTSSVPQAVLGFIPPCRITVFLDFTTPPLLDFSTLPTLPTPNESNFEIVADNHSWFAASNAVLAEFFDTRKTRINWLHRAAMYDILLMILGFPLSIWAAYRLGNVLERAPRMPSIISSAIYIYTFFFSLNVFRVLFSYSKWVFPKVELQTDGSSSPASAQKCMAGNYGAACGGHSLQRGENSFHELTCSGFNPSFRRERATSWALANVVYRQGVARRHRVGRKGCQYGRQRPYRNPTSRV